MNSKQLGELGEKIALYYLKNKGYQILDKNYFYKSVSGPKIGEIDLVTKKENIISFIEVKTLHQARGEPFQPEEKVDLSKKRKLIKTAESWLMKKKIPLDTAWQVDVISIKVDLNKKRAKIQHFKNAVF